MVLLRKQRNATVRHSAALTIVGTPVCPSISPFVRLSVTFENCVKMAEPIVMVPAPNRSLPNTARAPPYNLPVFVL